LNHVNGFLSFGGMFGKQILLTSRPHRQLFFFVAAVVVILYSSRRNGDTNGILIDTIGNNLTSRKNTLDGISGRTKFLVATVSVAALWYVKKKN